ncbi:hypothetical protein KQ51_00824 [Candidatus Izimaplasma bacterium HR1]|jgi:hypothetical protein|nr:hypothetical protein KQ51_00824 [Candidatus Izimaplasma bacterium HR1]
MDILYDILVYLFILLATIMVVSPRMFLNIFRIRIEYNGMRRTTIRIIGVVILVLLIYLQFIRV